MALINKYYVHVTKESEKTGVTVTSHPVERKIDVTDNVKRDAKVLSLTGEIVAAGGNSAATIKKALENLMNKGKYVKFIGVNKLDNALITSFSWDNDYSLHLGYSFTMEIKEIRVAKKAFKGKRSKGKNKQITKKNSKKNQYYKTKKGDTFARIAKKFYGDNSGSNIKKIKNANKSLKGVIKVGIRMIIPK